MAGSANLTKIDSNVTGLRYAEEASLCVLPAVPIWNPLEPNSYDAFGGEITTVARNPINSGRQRQKGTVVDLDASGGFQQDLTQDNLADVLQGFMFADYRDKNDVGADRQPRRTGNQDEFADYLITDILTTADTITVDSRVAVSAAVVAGGASYADGDVVEVTDANATVLARFIVTGETAGVVDTVALVFAGFTGGREGRTDTDTGAGAVTTAITGTGNNALTLTLTYGNGLVWQTNDLLWLTGNNDVANDGLFTVLSVADNVISTVENLTTDAAPAATATITTVGFQFAAGDLDVDASGALPTLTTAAEDFSTMGLVPGEVIFIGGDLAAERFTNVNAGGDEENNGWARIKSVGTLTLTLDKTQETMTTEASTTETVKVWFGRVLKNESDPTLQVRRSYQLERELGAPDPTLPAQIQSEYLIGSVSSELTYTMNTADKILTDLAFVSTNNEQRTGATGLKSGTRPALVSGDALNTSNDFSRLKMSILDPVDSNPTALFAFVTDFTISINNNLTPNKAISVLGAFEITAGQFNVEGNLTAYFADVTAVASVRNNDDITLDFAVVKGATGLKEGIAVDIPLIALGDGRLNVEQDSPITLPLDLPAAADRVFNHTLLQVYFDHLPDLADTA